MKECQQNLKLLQFNEDILEARVIERSNRFLVRVASGSKEFNVHLHDPGRLKELIYPGADVLIRRANGIKTEFSIVAAKSENEQVFLDSRYHNYIAERILGIPDAREIKLGNRRIDFRYGNKLIEIKGCTLLRGSGCYFPDAPSIRGTEQILELLSFIKNGGSAGIVFMCFRRGAEFVTINRETDPDLFKAIKVATSHGLSVEAHKICYEENSLFYVGKIKFKL